ncbi:hypothetical protein M9Y10_029264 [Tritrichomonas musculus]|uniref:GP63-like n=1 Tax=Tritrichomonas musculus TaxID=1915356 RepID=A0ABR2KLN3_9EUKA
MFFILLFFSFSNQANFYHACNHDFIQKQINVQEIYIETVKSKIRSKHILANEREPIRIHLDFRIDKDEYRCKEVGEEIYWIYGYFTCQSEDVPNETIKTALKGTIENVRDYLQNIILVDKVISPIKIKTKSFLNFNLQDAPDSVNNTDLFLSVFIRTYGESNLIATANYYQKDSETYRPLQGAIFVNSRYIPTEVQNENSKNNKFFYTLIHEIFHVFGISYDLFKYYHPKDSNVSYINPLVELHDKKTGKKHKFLVTPYSHKFAVMQWGVENFTIDGVSVPSGIEIEDGGEPEMTAGSHPECRIANQDLMIGINIQRDVGPYCRFTPLTAAILLDTGNYDIVWTKIQPLVWGNKDSIDGNYIKDFVTGPPANVFPQQYIYRPSSDPYFDRCGFTFKMVGGLSKFSISKNQNFNCSRDEWKNYSNTRAYCEAEKFYNPNGDDEIGSEWTFDFQIFHHPSTEVCQRGSACIAGMQYCAPYKIADDEKSFNITIRGSDLMCDKENENKFVYKVGNLHFGYGFKCPPIEQFIRTVRMMEDQPYLKGNPFDDENQISPSSGSLEQTVDFEASISSDEGETPILSSDKETIISSNEEETIVSSNKEETLFSSSDKETIISSNEEETLFSSSDKETIISSNEEETPISSNEEETPISSNEEETIISSNEKETIISSNKEETLFSSSDKETIISSNEEETLFSSSDKETIISSNEEETLFSSSDKETIISSNEEETPISSNEEETPISSNEEETPISSNEEETPISSNEEETIISSNEKETIISSNKEETLFSSSDKETIISSNEEETLFSSSDKETIISSNEEETPISSNEEETLFSSNEKETIISSNEEETLFSSSDKETIISSNEEETIISSNEEETIISSNEEETIISSNEKETPTSSSEEETLIIPDESQTKPLIEIACPTPYIDNSSLINSETIIFTGNGYKDEYGNMNDISNNENDIFLIKSYHNYPTISSNNSRKNNLFVSPQINNPFITIQMSGDQDGPIGLHVNSNNPTVKLPKSEVPLNLFSNEKSRVSFVSDHEFDSVPISFQKVIVSGGDIRIDLPSISTSVEFKEVETFSDSRIETYQNDNATLETSIAILKMNHCSNIELQNVSFINSISLGSGSNLIVHKRAKFNDQTIINLADTSLINFGDSLVEGICKEINLKITNQNKNQLNFKEEEETFAKIICGSNFDCSAWKEKYNKKSFQYLYAKCIDGCLIVGNKSDEKNRVDNKSIEKKAIIGTVVACFVTLVIGILIVVKVFKKRQVINDDQYSDPMVTSIYNI